MKNLSPIERNKIIMRTVRESIVASSQNDVLPHLEAVDDLHEIGEKELALALMNRFDRDHKQWEELEEQKRPGYTEMTGIRNYGFSQI